MNEAIEAARAHIAHIGALMFDRQLTDVAGGNISVRVDDVVCMSPSFSGGIHHWNLKPQDVLVVSKDGTILEGTGKLSRESRVHLGLHAEFGEHGKAVIHAHARNVLVFAVMNRPIPAVMEATLKFGDIPVVAFAPSHTPELAENIAGAIRGKTRIRKHAAAAIAPWHGLFVMGKDLNAAFDAVERIDTNAYCILMGQMLNMPDAIAAKQAELVKAAAAFGKE